MPDKFIERAADYAYGKSLSDLSRATTAYFEAPPESVENARNVYLAALRVFNSQDSGAAA